MESDTCVHTYWTPCSKLGSKFYIRPHTTPKTTVIHVPSWHGAPNLPNRVTHWQGRRAHRTHTGKGKEGSTDKGREGRTRKLKMKGKEIEEEDRKEGRRPQKEKAKEE